MIDCIDESNEVDLVHVSNSEHRETVSNLISAYNPDYKMRETDVKMSIILKDNDPVYQAPRRLALSEREEVHAHIENWLH